MKRHISRTAGALIISSALLSSVSIADSLSGSTSLTAYEVQTGCTIPSAPKNAFYVDAVNGSDALKLDKTPLNDGSAAKPWKSLPFALGQVAYLVPARTTGILTPRTDYKGVPLPIKGGDVIYLKSGNYGAVRLDGFQNTDFLTIAAAPGATPIIEGWTSYASASNLVFQGLTFKKGGITVRGAVRNIIVDGNTFTQGAEAANWTPAQWNANPMSASWIEGTCTSHTNNTARFIGFGFQVGGDKALIKNNVVDFYNGDGIRFMADNTTIIGNTVTNHYGKTGSENHNDAMQGYIYDRPGTNLVIDRNYVNESTGKYKEIPAIPTGNGSDYTQGISIFDGDWRNIRVTNNVVMGSAYHGLSFYGVDGGLVANNVVISSQPNGVRPFWIKIANRKDRVLTKNVVVRNNIANAVLIDSPTTTISDHNIQTTKPEDYFTKFNRVTSEYDFRPKAGSAMIAAGLNHLAPLVDIESKPHNNPIDIGAYAYKAATTPTTPPVTSPTPTPAPTPAPVPVVTSVKHTVTFKANARINSVVGTPKMNVVVDGRVVGTAVVSADMHLGQVGTYSFNFTTATQPKLVSLVLDGYAATPIAWTQLGVFNVTYGPTGQAPVEILRSTSVVSKVTAGEAKITPTSDVFYTKGATIEWSVGGLK